MTVIKVENLSKQYRLGNVGLGSLSHDLNRWYQTSVRRRDDPYLKIGEANDRSVKGNSEYVWALQDINFEVKQGEVLGIIGRNGAGKSTLLKILSRTTTPTTGQIKIKGRVASLLEVGTGFHPELTGRENIFLNGAILGMTKREIKSKFDEIVDFAGVERYIDTPVKRYSSGMYVRLAFGVAAHLEPEILIVDEVLAVGDVEFQKKALGKMKDVSTKDGRTVLFVSHNLASVLNLCEKIILLENGTIKEIGDSTKVISNYMRNDIVKKNDFKNNTFLANKAIPYFQLLNFYFKNHSEDNVAIKANQNFVIELIIEGIFLLIDNRFNLGYTLKNETGETIIISYSTDMPEKKWLNLEKGRITINTFIDTSMLNEGKYYVYLLGSIHCEKMLFVEEDNIRLDFEIIGNRGNSPYWINRRNTIMAPYIEWEINK
jgi:lipopolysaccharide transport system ATP-binding protein